MSSQAALEFGENVGGSESSLKSMLLQQLRQRELKAANRNEESPMSRLKEFAAAKRLSSGQHQPGGGISEAKRPEENLNSQLTGSEPHHGPDETATTAVFSSQQAPEKDKSVPEPGAVPANSAAVTSSVIAPSHSSIENAPSPLSRLEAFAAKRKAAAAPLSSPAVPFQADSAIAAAMSNTDRAAAHPEATAAVKLSAAPSAPPAVVAVELQPADSASVAMPVRASATDAAGVSSLTSTLPPIVIAASIEAHPDLSRVTAVPREVPPEVPIIASSPAATTPVSHFPAGNYPTLNRPHESVLEIGNVSVNSNFSASPLLADAAFSMILPGFSSKNAREANVYRGAVQHNRDDFEHSSYHEMHFHDGSHYKGEWHGGKFQGYGVYTYADGSRYEGQWSAGKKNGHGKHTYESDGECAQYCWCAGDVYDGEWTFHQRHGSAVYTWSDKSQLDCVWFEGQCTEWHDLNAKILSSKQAALQNESSAFRSNSVDVVPFVEYVSNVVSTFSSMPSAPTRSQPSTFTTIQPASSSSGPIVSPSSTLPPTLPPTLPHTRTAASSHSPSGLSSIHPHLAPVPALPSTFTSLGDRQLQPLRLCSRFLGDVIAMYSLRPLAFHREPAARVPKAVVMPLNASAALTLASQV